jgi:transposase
MKGKTYQVRLSGEEEKLLEEIAREGPPRQAKRARILLLLNRGEERSGNPARAPGQSEIAERCRCHVDLVHTVGKQYVREGMKRVINRKKRETPPVPAKVTGELRAKIAALRSSEPPPGHSRWTLRLMEERSAAELGIKLSDSAIRLALKQAPRQD